MKNKIILITLLCVCIVVAIMLLINKNDKEEKNTNNNMENTTKNYSNENYTNIAINESEKNMVSYIKIIVNGKKYNAKIEENETAQSFANMLPLELNMSELNGNEKYSYLDKILPTNSYNPKHIEAGDIMLYGNDCLVIFYKSFDTPYSYTKIGHIESIKDLGNKNVFIKFEK